MKARFALVTVIVLQCVGIALAQEEATQHRFEVSVEKGDATVLSGPRLKGISNGAVRFGFAPSRNFQLTLTYSKWEGDLARDDGLGSRFAAKLNATRPSISQIAFQDSVMDRRGIELEQMELGLVKTIPLRASKHFETYIGLGIGVQKAKADISWTGFQAPVNDPNARPEWQESENNQFLANVRGGLRYVPVSWFALQLNLKVIPIGRFFDEDYNAMELNAGVVFRFGKL